MEVRMNKTVWQWLPLLLIAVAMLFVWRDRQTLPPAPQLLPCVSLDKACRTTLAGHELQIGVSGPIKSMQPFEVWLKSPQARRVEARFAMKAMNMGTNVYTLEADKEGTYRATVTLAACISGDRDWIMTLDVDGAASALPFVMEP